jgi:hypothetical protein
MKRTVKPVESHIFEGMETAVAEQAEAAAVQQAAELTAKLIEPRQSIDTKAADIEYNSPLFYGTIHPTLF